MSVLLPEFLDIEPTKLSNITIILVLKGGNFPGIVTYSGREEHHSEGEDVSILALVLYTIYSNLRSHVHGGTHGSVHEAARSVTLQFLTKIEVDHFNLGFLCNHHVI